MNELTTYLATLQQRLVDLDAAIQLAEPAILGLALGRKLECEKSIADVERLIHECEVAAPPRAGWPQRIQRETTA